ncbi:MAG: mechanosensitive ion channel family protein [Lentisphaeria bacterium]|nr:mechanosensitive ion channel family protein [Lentisphaeria bacterium]
MPTPSKPTAAANRIPPRLPSFRAALPAAALLLLLVSAAAFAADTAETIRPPAAVIREVEQCAADTGSWFVRERGPWCRFLLGAGATLAVGGAALWLWFRAARRKERRREARSWKREAARCLIPPAIVLLMLVSCFFFFQPLAVSLPHRFDDFDMRIFYAAATLIVAWSALDAVSVLDTRLRSFARRNDNSLDDLTVGMVGAALRITVAVSCLFFIGQSIFDLNISALLAGAGVIGLAVALAAKETLANLFGTLVILADAPFRLGDRIRAGEIDGIVLGVGMRSTRILTADESVCTVPNSIFTATAVRRSSRRGLLKHETELSLVYDTSPADLARAETILHEILDDFHGPDDPKYRPHIFFSGFAESSLTIKIIVWFKTESFAEEERLLDELNSEILRRFGEAGLDFAYPTVTLAPRKAQG